MKMLKIFSNTARIGIGSFLLILIVSGCGGSGGSSGGASSSTHAPIAEWRITGTYTTAPWGIAVDNGNNVYVSEMFGTKIDKYSSAGTLITQWGAAGSGNSQFNRPKYIDLDGSGNVYVADNLNHRIQKFSSSGAYITQWGGYGIGNGQFNGPTGIAVDVLGSAVYVADSNNSRIEKFDLSGNYISQWGSNGTGNGQFLFDPYVNGGAEGGIAVDSMGAVFVVDHLNHRVQKFTTTGAYISQWGSTGSGNGQFLYPSGITIDNKDTVSVVDNSANNNLPGNIGRIEKFDSSGNFLSQWNLSFMGTGLCGGDVYGFAIAADNTGAVYVTQGECIDKYAP